MSNIKGPGEGGGRERAKPTSAVSSAKLTMPRSLRIVQILSTVVPERISMVASRSRNSSLMVSSDFAGTSMRPNTWMAISQPSL